MLDLFLDAAYTKTKQAELKTSMQSALESLPIDELMAITRGESPLCKTAHFGGDDPMCWLEHFQGTPLYEEALAIEKRQLELDMQENADRQKNQSIYNERDVLRVKRRMLELQLAEQQGSGNDEIQAAAPEGAAPAVAQTAAPAPTGEGAMNVAKTSADLTAAAREKIKPKNFALSAKQSDTGKPAYPIHDRRHAANALARVRQHGSAAERAEVYRDVARKYPDMARHSDVPEVKAKVAAMRFQLALTKQAFSLPPGIGGLASKAMNMAKANPTAALGLAGAGLGAAGGAVAGGEGHRLSGALKGGLMGGAAGAAGGYAAPRIQNAMGKGMTLGQAAQFTGQGAVQDIKQLGQQGMAKAKGMFGGATPVAPVAGVA